MLIDKSYFIGPLSISQLGHSAVVNNLNNFITRFETEVLTAALGYDLYKALIDAIEALGSDEDYNDLPDKWKNLMLGTVFTSQSGYKLVWNGIANPTTKRSILTPVIYTEILRDKAITETGIGTSVPQSENAETISPNLKITQAWWLMRQDILVLWELLRANQTVYTEYGYSKIRYSYFGSQNMFGI